MPYSGKTKIQVCDRLGKGWRRVADFLEIPTSERDGFEQGREAAEVWEWLDRRELLEKNLPDALTFIERGDLLLLLEPESTTVSPAQTQWTDSPYPGLLSFTPAQAPIFFGRSKEMKELAGRLNDPPQRFIAVIGASGSGKSSLVAAGLIPRTQPWPWIRLTPGGLIDNPFLALASALNSQLQAQAFNTKQIHDELRDTANIGPWLQKILANQVANAELLIFIDQFEELFTVVKEEHRKPFSILLGKMAKTERLRTVLTLRADFYHHCLDYPPLDTLLNAGHYSLKGPDLPAIMEMITGPAAVADLSFDDGLPGQILRDTGSEPGSLALMAFALSELHNACQPNKLLTQAAYDSFGGVRGAIAIRADTAYSGLDSAAQNAFGEVFKELVEVDPERGIPTRKRATKACFTSSPAALRFIENFASNKVRLLVCGDPDKKEDAVQVAHEALLTHWPRLRDWIIERFDDFRLLRQAKHEAAEWQRLGKPETHLWRHERLEPVHVMLNRLLPTLSETEKEFVRPEAERLLEKLHLDLTHQQREQIGQRLSEIGDPRPGVGLKNGLPDIVWLPVAGGEITLADNAETFPVAPFHISKYLVTWMQYRAFLEADDGHRNAAWRHGLAQGQPEPGKQYRQQLNCPADNVSWYDAIAFCRWLSNRLAYEVRLPTESEWQQAATGGDAEREFPWGPEWNSNVANTTESGLSRSIAVGFYPQGAAPGGALDMSGNLWEWCLNEHDNPERLDVSRDAERVVRGGSWYFTRDFARASYRSWARPDGRLNDFGFRVVCSSPID